MSDKPELKPCPFCGKQPEVYFDLPETKEGWNITCCNGIQICAVEEEAATDAWNHRADLAKPSEWIDVEKSIPETGVLVVATNGDDYTEVGFRSTVDEYPHDWVDFSFEVMYWMAIPSPPDKE